MDKNFKDPVYVKKQNEFIEGIQNLRSGCKRNFKKLKKQVKKSLIRYHEMPFEEMQKEIDKKFNTTFYQVK